MNIRYASLTDPGRRRSENQDSVLACQNGDVHLFAVADGVGGLQDGAHASRTAVTILREAFDSLPATGRMRHVAKAIEAANTAIGESRNHGSKPVSGSTIVVMLLEPEGASFAHVGDSRAYRVSASGVASLTEDHSLVAEQVRAGIITREQARTSRNRNVVTRSLGVADDVDIDTTRVLPALPGDAFVLCSDGLTDVVTDDEIGQIVRSHAVEEEAVAALVQLANDRGGPDNISVVLARVGIDDDA
ncbi:MAG: serine/threonine-protein phosphatase [Dehalococcoidia bacterium]|nr:serine/threonine-protein phosphatase [Dehalococcoidia bacterium]MCA9825289.1 serine/threonine-protein phosphatase [Dehalococcoidia bacterium]MCA9843767.1 serine/threonine-protein phosphatase [Dehalococcoidia bacterium]MCA9852160.1 serine/threonine-protein phosphatase [Dehalococcoidia bacterium]